MNEQNTTISPFSLRSLALARYEQQKTEEELERIKARQARTEERREALSLWFTRHNIPLAEIVCFHEDGDAQMQDGMVFRACKVTVEDTITAATSCEWEVYVQLASRCTAPHEDDPFGDTLPGSGADNNGPLLLWYGPLASLADLGCAIVGDDEPLDCAPRHERTAYIARPNTTDTAA